STQVGLVAGFLDHQSPQSSSTTADYFVDQKKPWISRFCFSPTPTTHGSSSHPQNHPAWAAQMPVNQALHGWLSNSESSLWFGGHVQFHRVAAIGQKYFYVILTEDDVVSASVPTDSQSIFRTVRVTRIARLCQNDPGQGKAGEFLATNGVFSTFRKIRLQCRVDHSLVGVSADDNKSFVADHSPQLELTRALAVSELVPTDDGRDHVFYALMTTSDSITGILGICAFSLRSIDEALNRPQVFTWQTSDSDNWLQRFWRTVLPLTGWSSSSEDDFTYGTWSAYPTPGSSTLRMVGNTPMTEAISKSAEVSATFGFPILSFESPKC
ncbi:hypothetical protein T265_14941, partial [Opisthorchis viverrini]